MYGASHPVASFSNQWRLNDDSGQAAAACKDDHESCFGPCGIRSYIEINYVKIQGLLRLIYNSISCAMHIADQPSGTDPRVPHDYANKESYAAQSICHSWINIRNFQMRHSSDRLDCTVTITKFSYLICSF
jgi:hypothetical protein